MQLLTILQSINFQTTILPLAVMAFAAAVIVSIVTPMITQKETSFFPSFLGYLFGFFVILFFTDFMGQRTNSKVVLFVLATPMVFGTMSLLAYYIAKAEIEKAVQVGLVSVFVSTIFLVGNILLFNSKPRLAPNPEGFVENQADQSTMFRENCQKGNYFAGIQISSNEKGISSIQATYIDVKGEYVKGKVYGKEIGEPQKIIAKKGFTVSGIDGIYAGNNIKKIRLSFLPIDPKSDEGECHSEWVGASTTEGTENLEKERKKFVTGYCGRISGNQIVQVTGFYGKQAN